MRFGIVILLILMIGCASIPLSPFPKNEYFSLAEENFLNGNYPESINYYQQFIASEKRSDYTAEAYYRIGVGYLALANYPESEKNLLEALKNPSRHNRNSFNVLTYHSLAQLYQAQHKYKQAIDYYRKVIKNNNGELSLTYIYYNLGICLMRNDKYAEGKKYLQLCLDNTNRALAEGSAQAGNESDDKLREHVTERLSMPPNTFTVQLGKYHIQENAIGYQTELQQEKGVSAIVNIILIDGKEFYYVWSGRYDTFEEAQKEADKINEKGIEAVVVP
ncbi:MAG: tetratricopeptide repeat protein [Planctomycetota bacterium]